MGEERERGRDRRRQEKVEPHLADDTDFNDLKLDRDSLKDIINHE